MIEYTNGQFGAIAPTEDILKLLQSKADTMLQDIKAVHFGTVPELVKIREEKVNYSAIREDIDALKREFEALKPQGIIKVFQIDDMPKRNYDETFKC